MQCRERKLSVAFGDCKGQRVDQQVVEAVDSRFRPCLPVILRITLLDSLTSSGTASARRVDRTGPAAPWWQQHALHGDECSRTCTCRAKAAPPAAANVPKNPSHSFTLGRIHSATSSQVVNQVSGRTTACIQRAYNEPTQGAPARLPLPPTTTEPDASCLAAPGAGARSVPS